MLSDPGFVYYSTKNSLLSFLGAVTIDDLPDNGCQCATYQRANDEDPQVSESCATLENGRSNGTGGVHRSARVADAHQVNEYQRQTDGKASEVL